MRCGRPASWIFLLSLGALPSTARGARAESGAGSTTVWVHVHRDRSAAVCPDAARVWSIVDALFPRHALRPARTVDESGLEVSIVISPHGAGYEAVLRIVGESALERRFVDQDPRCDGLGEALAVAVVLLVEPEAERAASTDARFESRSAEPSVSAHHPTPFTLRGELGSIGGGGLLGDIGGVSGGVAVSVAAEFGGPSLRVRGMRLWSPRESFRSGSVDVSLWGISFGPCWSFPVSPDWRVTPCAGLGLGEQTGTAHDYAINAAASRPWRVLTAEVSSAIELGGPVWGSVTAGGVLRLHDQSFLVGGQPAVRQAPAGWYFSLGLGASWEIVRPR